MANELARAILDTATIGRDGLIEFRPLDDYAAAIGLTVDETDELFDAALDALVESGTIIIVSGACHVTEQYLAYVESLEEHRQAVADEAQAYWDAVWR